MQDTKETAPNQFSSADNSPIELGVGGSASAPQTPRPAGQGGRNELLLYHSENNSDKEDEKKPYKPSNLEAKTFYALDTNCKHYLKIYGAEHIGLLTLTFKENLKCEKESQRRWNNLNRIIDREGKFLPLIKVKEYQKRGAVHYHLLVKTHQPIRGNIDWKLYEAMGETKSIPMKRKLGKQLAKTAEPHLVDLWSWLRKKAQATGFGRTELMPLKKPHHIKNYIGKYLEKDMQGKQSKTKGYRMITYGKKAPKVANTNFSWVSGNASLFRRHLKKYCDVRGIKDKDELEELHGKAWSYHLYKQIMNDEVYGFYLDDKHKAIFDPEHKQTAVYPWKGKVASGAFTDETKTKMMDAYLDRLPRSGGESLADHRKHLEKWKRAEKHKQFIERIYK